MTTKTNVTEDKKEHKNVTVINGKHFIVLKHFKSTGVDDIQKILADVGTLYITSSIGLPMKLTLAEFS